MALGIATLQVATQRAALAHLYENSHRSGTCKYSLKYTSISFVTKHVSLIFGIISFLLLIREIFTAATMNNIAKSNNEYFWYPLVALPQILRVFLYTVLGLIPSSRNGKSVTLPQHNNDSEL
ncbi:hypothetical protein C8J55DRAFT_293359 [Lentinula edodes]|uniref:Uncharacterized protein n=1 Tax=Lentinula lateritia TaxID=40482 RepID=A0A9W9DDI8_9AGAR|nr:hypothetical protein C8J55DRAFT_293359 [Lentinula edodes]